MAMRRFKQQIPHEEAMEILKQHDTGVLSVVEESLARMMERASKS